MITFNVLVSLATLAKAPSAWRHRRNPLIASFWLALAFLNLSMIVNQPPLYDGLGELTGLSNIAYPVSYGTGVIAGFWLQAFLMHSYQPGDAPRRVRRWAWGVTVVLVVMCAAYVAGPLRDVNGHNDTHVPADSLGDLALRLVLAGWALWAMPVTAVLCIRLARCSTSPVLRGGLLCAAIGTLPIVTRFVVEYGLYAVLSWQHVSQSAAEKQAIFWLNVATLVGLVMIVLGFAAPGLAQGVTALSHRGRSLLAYHRLGPLWRVTRPVSPSLPWVPHGLPVLRHLAFVGIDSRLYRRVIEIRDGLLVVMPYRDADLADVLRAEAASLGWADLESAAYLDAGALQAALRAYRDGDKPERVDGFTPNEVDGLDREVAYLTMVARFLRSGRTGQSAGLPDRWAGVGSLRFARR